MKKVVVLIACAATAAFFPAASLAQWPGQQQCSQVASYTNPNQLRCQAVGTNYLGKTIWLCC